MVFDILSSEKICETSTSCLIVIIALKQHIQTNIDMYPKVFKKKLNQIYNQLFPLKWYWYVL